MERAQLLLNYFALLQKETPMHERLEKVADEIEKELQVR
jgi:hypothetical protein